MFLGTMFSNELKDSSLGITLGSQFMLTGLSIFLDQAISLWKEYRVMFAPIAMHLSICR
jgi:hypothetical protein